MYNENMDAPTEARARSQPSTLGLEGGLIDTIGGSILQSYAHPDEHLHARPLTHFARCCVITSAVLFKLCFNQDFKPKFYTQVS